MKKLQIKNIQQDPELTPRSAIDKATVESYAVSYEQLPPIDVFWIEDRDGWWIVDGNHRFEAAKSLKDKDGKPLIKIIECNEHQGSFNAALEFAYDANLNHGRPLNTKEKRAAARLKLILHTERSDTWISADCGVSAASTVAPLRVELEEEDKIEKLDKLLGRDGVWQARHRNQNRDVPDKPEPETRLYYADMLKMLKKDVIRKEKVKDEDDKKWIDGKKDIVVKFDLVVADPPYGVTDHKGTGSEKSWDAVDIKRETKKWLKAILPHLAEKHHLFWFCSPDFAADVEIVFRELELPIQSRIVWERRNMTKGGKAKNRFRNAWEMCFHTGNKPLNFDDDWSDAWNDVQRHAVPQMQYADRKVHPTQKPINLIQRLVQFGSNEDEHVLDPFAGGGTTGAACQNLERNCTLIEIEPEFIGTIQARLGILEESKKGKDSGREKRESEVRPREDRSPDMGQDIQIGLGQ